MQAPNLDNSEAPIDINSLHLEENVPIIQTKDVCEGFFENTIELNEINSSCAKGDGSDSGLDLPSTINLRLQRALSSNSGDYASSSGGIDIETNINDNISCGSSLISFTSDLGGEHRTFNIVKNRELKLEYCSENCNESSQNVTGFKIRKNNNVKKKVGMFEPTHKPSWKTDSSIPSTAGQMIKIKPNSTLHTKSDCASLQTRERARSREKAEKPLSNASSKNSTPPFRSTPVRRPQKPDSLPCALNSTLSIQRGAQRTPSSTRARTPGTPSDDGRWPSVGSRVTGIGKRGSSVTPDIGSIRFRGQPVYFESKCVGNSSNTLPRRRKQKSVEDLRDRTSRSSSNSRDNGMVSSINASSKKNTISQYCTPSKANTPLVKLTYRKLASRTRIYHEMGVQTVMTGQDVEKAFAGDFCRLVQVDSAELSDKQTQSDFKDIEIESLREEVQKLMNKQSELSGILQEKTQKIVYLENQITKEREEKISVQRELNQNTERVIGMLEFAKHTQPTETSCDSLMMLESQIQMSGHELLEKQEEIFKLRKLCRTLQAEMERVLVAQECLIQEKNSIEREAIELQDFLQHEKTTMCDALNESEFEYQHCKKTLSEKEEEIKVLRDECRHLVRLNEQRRQENKLMQSKYALLETKSNELKLHQNRAVAGASMALSGLYSRLDNLVEQLISSYNISERDLEDIAYHNEAYANSASSNDTPELETNTDIAQTEQTDGSLSPQRNQSFIAAVIGAIRNATVPSSKKLRVLNGVRSSDINNGDESDSTEMLDSETEPCLMMDNVLEDVTMPDSHSHNMVSSIGIAISQIELPPDLVHGGDDSLQNLSQAITNRQQAELQITSTGLNIIPNHSKNGEKNVGEDISFHESVAEMPSIIDYCPTQGLVDQVIEVDNLITKLLKVLRLIQMDNDACIQQLIVDKNKLQQNKEDMLEKFKDLEDINIKLQDELMDATQELMLKNSDLSTSKADIQRHRNEIDKLNEDICQLSTLCSHNNSKCNSLEEEVSPEKMLRIFKSWNDEGYFAKADVELFLRDLSSESHKQTNENEDNFGNRKDYTIEELKRQYETIQNALNVLNELPSIVMDNPLLQQLQRDLENTKYQSIKTNLLSSSLISSSAKSSQDHLNANDSENFSCQTSKSLSN